MYIMYYVLYISMVPLDLIKSMKLKSEIDAYVYHSHG